MQNASQLEAIISSLGCKRNNKYIKEPYCLENIRELIKALMHDDNLKTVRQVLGKANILTNDLIPILKTYSHDIPLTETVMRLVLNLTQPVHDCFEGQVPTDRTERKHYLAVLWHLQGYKRSLSDVELWCVVGGFLGLLIQKSWLDRTQNDRNNIERWLFLIRNALLVGNDSIAELNNSNSDPEDHSKLVCSMAESGLFQLLLCLGQFDWKVDRKFESFPHYIIEIVALLLKQQNPRSLALQDHSQANQDLVSSLLAQRDKEKNSGKPYKRHSRFGGVYVVPAGNNSIITRGSVQPDQITFDKNKELSRMKKKHKSHMFSSSTCSFVPGIASKQLREFCNNFLTHCFPPIVRLIKPIWEFMSDERGTYWCWVVAFFMTFSRINDMGVGFVSDLLTVDSFKHITCGISRHLDEISLGASSNRQKVIISSSRLHLTILVYRELLMTIKYLSNDTSLVDSINVLQENIYYCCENFDVLISVFKRYSASVMSRRLVCDLVETVDMYVSMFQTYIQSKTHFFVKTIKRRIKHSSKTSKKSTSKEMDWELIESAVAHMGDVHYEGPFAFDPSLEFTEDEQIMRACYRIKQCLLEGNVEQGVGLLHHCQEIWPEQSMFSGDNINESFQSVVTCCKGVVEDDEHSDNSDQQSSSAEEEYTDKEMTGSDLMHKLSCPSVLLVYVTVLESFVTNSDATNKAVVRILDKMVNQFDMPGILLQMRVLRIYQKVLSELKMTKTSRFEEIRDFIGGLFAVFVKRFADVGGTSAVELLFWKNHRNSYNLTHGADTYELVGQSGTRKGRKWTEEEDYELSQLFTEFRGVSKTVVPDIMTKLIRKDRTKRQIVRRLVHLELIQSSAELKASKKSKNAVDSNYELLDWLLQIYSKGQREVIEQVVDILSNELAQREDAELCVRVESGQVDDATYSFLRYTGFRHFSSVEGCNVFRFESSRDLVWIKQIVDTVLDCKSRIVGSYAGNDDCASVVAATEADGSEDDRFLDGLDDMMLMSSAHMTGQDWNIDIGKRVCPEDFVYF